MESRSAHFPLVNSGGYRQAALLSTFDGFRALDPVRDIELPKNIAPIVLVLPPFQLSWVPRLWSTLTLRSTARADATAACAPTSTA